MATVGEPKTGKSARQRFGVARICSVIASFVLSGDAFDAAGTKQKAEKCFGNRVDIRVPEAGLGPRLNWMREWCRTRIEAQHWGAHGHHVTTARGRVQVVRFYFAYAEDAAAFSRKWGPACATGQGVLHSAIARTEAALSACLGANGQGLYAF